MNGDEFGTAQARFGTAQAISRSWLVTGARGMLGRELVDTLRRQSGATVTAADRSQLDITDPTLDASTVARYDVVVNTAAWTDVDGAEERRGDAFSINGDAVERLSRACAAAGVPLLHLSTDYVFPGSDPHPISEGAETQPVNAYGESKLAGEQAVLRHLPDRGFIIRTAWLYGPHGRNFVATMLHLAARSPVVTVVNDQVGQPTGTAALSDQLVALGDAAATGRAPAGIYHGTSSGQTSWFGLAQATFELAGLDPGRVEPVSSAAFARPARRPAHSILGHDRWAATAVAVQPHWRDQLGAMLRRSPFTDLAAKARSAAIAGFLADGSDHDR